VIDLGSGDGRTSSRLRSAAPGPWVSNMNRTWLPLSTRNAAKEGVSDKTEFIKADLFETDFFAGHGHHDVPIAGDQPQASVPAFLA